MKANVKTEIPGPNSKKLQEDRTSFVARGHGSISEIFIDIALGANLIDVDGNIFIDFAGGIGTMNIGHSHPKVVSAIQTQSSQYILSLIHI